MKKTIQLAALLLSVCLIIPVLAACGNLSADADGVTYVSLRINPEIELIADENGEVLAANAVNTDGETVLSETELVGMTVEEAGEAFTDKATELGYIDPNSKENTVYVDAEGEDAEALERSLADKINRYFDNKGIYGKVSPDTLERYAANVDKWGVSAGHAKMIMRVLDLYPEMTEDEVLALSVKERLALLKDNKKNNGLSAELREEYKAAVKGLREEYADLKEKKARLEALENDLADVTLSSDERNGLTVAYEALKTEYDARTAEYREKLAALKSDYKAKSKDSLDKAEEKAEKKRNDNKEKLEKHAEKVEKDKAAITEAIQKWRNAE